MSSSKEIWLYFLWVKWEGLDGLWAIAWSSWAYCFFYRRYQKSSLVRETVTATTSEDCWQALIGSRICAHTTIFSSKVWSSSRARFSYKIFDGTSTSKKVSERLCEDKLDWASHLFYANKLYNMQVEDDQKLLSALSILYTFYHLIDNAQKVDTFEETIMVWKLIRRLKK